MPRKPTTPRPIKLSGHTVQAFRGPNADGLWYYKISSWQDGKRTWKALGWISRESAEQALMEAVQGKGQGPESEDTQIRTIKDLMECWLGAQRERQDIRPNSFRNYRYSAKRITDGMGNLLVLRIGQRDIEAWRDASLKAGMAPRYLWNCLKVLHAAWNWGRGISEAITRDLPLVTVRIPEERVYNHYTPTDEEVEAVVAGLQGWPRAGLILLQATGARISEIAGIHWEDVRVAEKAVWLMLDGKTGRRTIPIPQATWDRVSEILGVGIHGLISGRETVLQGENSVQKAMEWYFTGHAGNPFSPHALRRAKVDAMARSQVEIGTACKYLSHSATVMLEAYRRISDEDLLGAMEQVEAAPRKRSGTR